MFVDDLEIQPCITNDSSLTNACEAMGLSVDQIKQELGPRLEPTDGQSLHSALKDHINEKIRDELQSMRWGIQVNDGLKASNLFNKSAADLHQMALIRGITRENVDNFLNALSSKGQMTLTPHSTHHAAMPPHYEIAGERYTVERLEEALNFIKNPGPPQVNDNPNNPINMLQNLENAGLIQYQINASHQTDRLEQVIQDLRQQANTTPASDGGVAKVHEFISQSFVGGETVRPTDEHIKLFLEEYKAFLDYVGARTEAGPQLSPEELMANLGYYETEYDIYELDQLREILEFIQGPNVPSINDNPNNPVNHLDNLEKAGLITYSVNGPCDTTKLEQVIARLEQHNLFEKRETFTENFRAELSNKIEAINSGLRNNFNQVAQDAQQQLKGNELKAFKSDIIRELYDAQLQQTIKAHLTDRSAYAYGQGPTTIPKDSPYADKILDQAKATLTQTLNGKVDLQELQSHILATANQFKQEHGTEIQAAIVQFKDALQPDNHGRLLSDRADRNIESRFDRYLLDHFAQQYANAVVTSAQTNATVNLNELSFEAKSVDNVMTQVTEAVRDALDKMVANNMARAVTVKNGDQDITFNVNNHLKQAEVLTPIKESLSESFIDKGVGVAFSDEAISGALLSQVQQDLTVACISKPFQYNTQGNSDKVQTIENIKNLVKESGEHLANNLKDTVDNQFQVFHQANQGLIEQAQNSLLVSLAIQPHFDPSRDDLGFEDLSLQPREFINARLHEEIARHMTDDGKIAMHLNDVTQVDAASILNQIQNEYLTELEIIDAPVSLNEVSHTHVVDGFTEQFSGSLQEVANTLRTGDVSGSVNSHQETYRALVESTNRLIERALSQEQLAYQTIISSSKNGFENFQALIAEVSKNPYDNLGGLDNNQQYSEHRDMVLAYLSQAV